MALAERDDEGLEVLAPDGAQGPRHAPLDEEPVEPIERPQVGADRSLAFALAPEVEDRVVAGAGKRRPSARLAALVVARDTESGLRSVEPNCQSYARLIPCAQALHRGIRAS